MPDPYQMCNPGRSAVQSSGINNHRSRTSGQKHGKMLEKGTSAFWEDVQVVNSAGPFSRELSKAAQANPCKEFFKFWKD